MNLRTAVAKLKAVFGPAPRTARRAAADHREFVRRLEAVLAPVLATDGPAGEALDRYVGRELEWCDHQYPPSWPAALRLFFDAVPGDLRAVVFTDETLGIDPRNYRVRWAADWIGRIKGGYWCRLPPDIDLEVMGRFVAIYTGRENPACWSSIQVCDRCGLGRPYPAAPPGWGMGGFKGKLPEPYWTCCPHCRSTEWTWSSRLDEQLHPWQDTAKAELASIWKGDRR